jgi:hypothetical protein
MEHKLFEAIIRQAIEDLFDKSLQADTLEWFMDDTSSGDDKTLVTIKECCDLTGRTSPIPLRKLAKRIVDGEISKLAVMEYFTV